METRVLKKFENDFMQMDFVAISRVQPELFKKHCHDRYELLFFVDADGQYVIEDKTYKMSSGDAVLIAPGKYHFLKYSARKNYRRIVFGFSPEFFPDSALAGDVAGRVEFFGKAHYTEFSKTMTDFSEKCLSTPDVYMPALIRSAIEWALLSTLHIPPVPYSSEENEGLCSRAVRYISDHLGEISNTDQIAAALFVSKSSLQHAFKKTMDIPVMQYLRIKRLFAVRKLIAEGEGLKKSAEKAGYSEYTTFYRSFKSYFGYPPADIKTSLKNTFE